MARLFLTQTHLISVNEIQWCYHSNDISSAERLHKTIFFQHFSRPVPFGQYYIMIEIILTIQQKSTRKALQGIYFSSTIVGPTIKYLSILFKEPVHR